MNLLPRSTPERQGIASADLHKFVETLESQMREIHSVLLLRHGHVIAEGWWSPYEHEHPHMLFSVSKSFTSTAVGLAVNEGYFLLDDKVLSFFQTPIEVSDNLASMKVRHLLTMSTGHAEDTWGGMLTQPDWIKAFFEVPVLHAPGTHFLYNTGATYLLAAIVQKTTGMKLIDYLKPRLFEPLGIENATWEESPQGIALGGIGLSITTEDLAKFGQLYLQKGMWQGQQLVPESWVTEATSFQISNGDDPQSDWAQGYGYQFWRCRHSAYRGDGVFGQYCVVMPEQDAVLAITGGIDVFDMQHPLDVVWEKLLPAMCPDALPDDDAVHAALVKKLSGLSLPPVQGQTTSQVFDRLYKVDANELNIETISLNFSESGCTLTVKTAAGKDTIPCGYGEWQRGQTRLFGRADMTAASGAWTGDQIFTMVIRLVETPFFHTLVFHFDDDELMVETRVSVSLGDTQPLLFTARRVV